MSEVKSHFGKGDIRTGDILIWSESGSNKGDLYLKIVRLLTVSDYGHVSVAWRHPNGILHHVEATQPVIRQTLITETDTFYCIPTGMRVDHDAMERFFHDKIGAPYSFWDAFSAFIGRVPKQDNRWQCVELANTFCKQFGIDVGNAYRPDSFVKALLDITYGGLHHIPPDTKRTV